jgi:GTP-binding protein HflX
VWISAEKRLGLELLAEAVAERLTRFARRARIRIEASAGALRSRLYAAKAVRDEHSADDGSIELGVELPDVELLVLARTAGVRILQMQGEDLPCAPETTYLQSTAVSGGPPRQ